MSDVTPRPQAIPSGEYLYSLVPPEFGAAAGVFGREQLMRRMLRDPWLGLADLVIRAMVVEGEHRVVPAIGDLAPDADAIAVREKGIADRVADFHRRWIAELRRTLWHLMEALPYGHKLAEVEWAIVDAGEDRGRVAPVDVAPKPRGAYTLEIDKANRLVGVKPGGLSGNAEEALPPSSVLLFSLCGRDDHPEGTPALERAYDAWYRKNCAKPQETRALTTYAGGIHWAEATDGQVASTVKVLREGKTEDLPATQVIAGEIAKLKTGVVAAMPPGWSLKHLPPASSFKAFDSSYDRANAEMVTALLVAARSVMEARFGSRADSQTAEGFVQTIRDWIRGELCTAVDGLLRTATVANFGPESARFSPTYRIVTEERGEIGAIAGAVGSFAAAGLMTPELADHLLALIGVPESVRRTVMESVRTSAPTPPALGTQFADDDPTERPKPPKVNVGAQRKADKGTQKIVERYDRRLRKLAVRFTDGKLGGDAFEAAFSGLLAKGHEEAATLGTRLAGVDRDRLPAAVREMLAATLADEGDHLTDLIDAFQEGRRTAAQVNLAARRYAKRMGGTVSAAFHEASPSDAQFWWKLGAADNCPSCPRLESMSPYLRDELITRPREGETECHDNCQCRLVRGDGACGPGPVLLGSYDDQDDPPTASPASASGAPTEPVDIAPGSGAI